MMPHFASPYNCEKRRFNEEQLLEQAAKCAEAANVALPPAYNDMGKKQRLLFDQVCRTTPVEGISAGIDVVASPMLNSTQRFVAPAS